MKSIRSRLLLGTVVGAALVLSATGVTLHLTVRASLMAEFDKALADKARTLAALAEMENGRVELDIKDLDMPEFRRADRPEYLQVWRPDGRVMYRSPSLGSGELDKREGSLDSPGFYPVVLPDGLAGRMIAVTFQPRPNNEKGEPRPQPSQDSPWLTLTLTRHTGEVDAVLARLRYLLIVVGSVAVVVTSTVLVSVVHGGLRPLHRLAGQIEELDGDNLSARVELPHTPSELTPIVDRLNDLLARLEASFRREKAFTSDVAHELRTPLAGLRSTLEVSALKTREPDAYRAAIQESLTITHQMQTMVQSLLSLARMEAGQVQVDRECVDVAALLRECWGMVDRRAAERGLRMTWGLADSCLVETDGHKLRQVLQNLLDNAVSYTDKGGSIEARTKVIDSQALIEIINTGCRLTPEDVERVFDRFWRGDAARRDTGIHCGLGLSLARRIVTLLGGDIRAECTADGVFRVCLSIGAPSA